MKICLLIVIVCLAFSVESRVRRKPSWPRWVAEETTPTPIKVPGWRKYYNILHDLSSWLREPHHRSRPTDTQLTVTSTKRVTKTTTTDEPDENFFSWFKRRRKLPNKSRVGTTSVSQLTTILRVTTPPETATPAKPAFTVSPRVTKRATNVYLSRTSAAGTTTNQITLKTVLGSRSTEPTITATFKPRTAFKVRKKPSTSTSIKVVAPNLNKKAITNQLEPVKMISNSKITTEPITNIITTTKPTESLKLSNTVSPTIVLTKGTEYFVINTESITDEKPINTTTNLTPTLISNTYDKLTRAKQLSSKNLSPVSTTEIISEPAATIINKKTKTTADLKVTPTTNFNTLMTMSSNPLTATNTELKTIMEPLTRTKQNLPTTIMESHITNEPNTALVTIPTALPKTKSISTEIMSTSSTYPRIIAPIPIETSTRINIKPSNTASNEAIITNTEPSKTTTITTDPIMLVTSTKVPATNSELFTKTLSDTEPALNISNKAVTESESKLVTAIKPESTKIRRFNDSRSLSITFTDPNSISDPTAVTTTPQSQFTRIMGYLSSTSTEPLNNIPLITYKEAPTEYAKTTASKSAKTAKLIPTKSAPGSHGISLEQVIIAFKALVHALGLQF